MNPEETTGEPIEWDPTNKSAVVEHLHTLVMSAVLDGKQEYFFDWLESYFKGLKRAGFESGYAVGWSEGIRAAKPSSTQRKVND